MSDKIHELNKRRCAAADMLRILGYQNSPIDPKERLVADARYRLAKDVAERTESEYRAALAALSTEELMALSYLKITDD